jgi:hypothetical protein
MLPTKMASGATRLLRGLFGGGVRRSGFSDSGDRKGSTNLSPS